MTVMNFYEPKHDFKVLCHCITYNQAKYIVDTMDGFCMQKTDFPFVCYIIDDASTDGEQGVIKTYLNDYFDIETAEIIDIETSNVIIAKHKTNENCTFAVYLLKQNLWNNYALKVKHEEPWRCHCKYIAFCEGDDYWIDPNKLKKQVDALDANPKAMMCYTGFETVNENGKLTKRPYFEQMKYLSHSGDIFIDLITDDFIMTLTTCYRTEIANSDLLLNSPVLIDKIWFLAAAALGDTIYMPEITSAYRSVSTSLTNSNIGWVKSSVYKARNYILLEYYKGNIIKKYNIIRHFGLKIKLMKIAILEIKNGNNVILDELKREPFFGLYYMLGISKLYLDSFVRKIKNSI